MRRKTNRKTPKMGSIAEIKITDLDSNEVHKINGKAEKTLMKGLNYIREKDGSSNMNKTLNFIKKDFAELEKQFELLIYGNDKQ